MQTSQPHILIVEDEPDLATLIRDYVNASEMRATIIDNGNAVEPWLKENQPDLILLDVMLPGKNGLDICKSIRKDLTVPIIIVTAKMEEIDRLLGLELGADDYICKPFSPREVIARIKTVLRRTYSSPTIKPTNQNKPNKKIVIHINPQSYIVSIDAHETELTQIEFKIFTLLFENPGRIYSRQHILDNIYNDYRVVSDRTVDSHIKKLRKKLNQLLPKSSQKELEIIRSVYGAGYKYDPA